MHAVGGDTYTRRAHIARRAIVEAALIDFGLEPAGALGWRATRGRRPALTKGFPGMFGRRAPPGTALLYAGDVYVTNGDGVVLHLSRAPGLPGARWRAQWAARGPRPADLRPVLVGYAAALRDLAAIDAARGVAAPDDNFRG